jgi:thiol:disulfide interchange protein DsbD
LACGFWGAPLKQISAFLPPQNTKQEFRDYEAGMEYAAKNKMPVFVDFTGFGCVNCRKMEAAVFTNADVDKLMSQFVVINLYVDDRTPLPKPMIVEENGKKLELDTKGEEWSYLQRIKFGANAQPFYVLLDNEGKPIAGSYAYDEDTEKFIGYLKHALAYYEQMK